MSLQSKTCNFMFQGMADMLQAHTTLGLLGVADSPGKVDKKRKGSDSLQDLQGGKQQKIDEQKEADLQSLKMTELSEQPGDTCTDDY